MEYEIQLCIESGSLPTDKLYLFGLVFYKLLNPMAISCLCRLSKFPIDLLPRGQLSLLLSNGMVMLMREIGFLLAGFQGGKASVWHATITKAYAGWTEASLLNFLFTINKLSEGSLC